MKEKIYFAKIKQNAIVPSKREEDAGYDFYACFEEDFISLAPFETKPIPTGIAWACSPKYYLQIEERSSTGFKGIKKSAGVIDSGYRGEINVLIFNSLNKNLIFSNLEEKELLKKYPHLTKSEYLFYSTKKAFAQGIVHEVINLETEEVSYEKLKTFSSQRGSNGFGSTNKN